MIMKVFITDHTFFANTEMTINSKMAHFIELLVLTKEVYFKFIKSDFGLNIIDKVKNVF